MAEVSEPVEFGSTEDCASHCGKDEVRIVAIIIRGVETKEALHEAEDYDYEEGEEDDGFHHHNF